MARRSRKSTSSKRKRASTRTTLGKQQEVASKNVDFAEEYRYVVSDLKRFGVLAVAMFATLIILALTI